MTKPKTRATRKPRPAPQVWTGPSGFLLGEFTEADMERFAAGQLPDWLPRLARSLLLAANKYGLSFEPQDPAVRG